MTTLYISLFMAHFFATIFSLVKLSKIFEEKHREVRIYVDDQVKISSNIIDLIIDDAKNTAVNINKIRDALHGINNVTLTAIKEDIDNLKLQMEVHKEALKIIAGKSKRVIPKEENVLSSNPTDSVG